MTFSNVIQVHDERRNNIGVYLRHCLRPERNESHSRSALRLICICGGRPLLFYEIRLPESHPSRSLTGNPSQSSSGNGFAQENMARVDFRNLMNLVSIDAT
jgi:hypothetical protein